MTNRDKRPGERILNTDGRFNRYYDIQASTTKAKVEQWGCHDETLTPNQRAAENESQNNTSSQGQTKINP
jgi:hypothetical protein